ncbi:hypothetical protein EVB91_180 [Rhizobium phage RHph_I1_18]|nr:hypothetical protein EVB91_180 [Rhizobium phage RHph_I1_18]
MASRTKFTFGQSIIEIYDTELENEEIYMTVSKERWDEDRIQFVIPRHLAKALGHVLKGISD